MSNNLYQSRQFRLTYNFFLKSHESTTNLVEQLIPCSIRFDSIRSDPKIKYIQ